MVKNTCVRVASSSFREGGINGKEEVTHVDADFFFYIGLLIRIICLSGVVKSMCDRSL